MTKFALIHNNSVCEIVDSEDQRFEVHSDLFWVQCDDTVSEKHSYDNGTFIEPTPPSYSEMRVKAYNDAGLTATNYIDELRKERLGLPNSLAEMDATAIAIKEKYPSE